MTLVEQTEAWLQEHKLAGRTIEAAACEVRLKVLRRCQDKQAKPQFIHTMRFKTESEITQLRHVVHRGTLYEHYRDDLLLAHVRYQAIADFTGTVLGVRIKNVWPRL